MSWAEQKAKLKAIVHSTFVLPALYTTLDGDIFPTQVRLNTGEQLVGGLPRYGFAQVLQESPKIRIDPADLPINFQPSMGEKISIPSEGKVFDISNIAPKDSIYFVLELQV